MSPAVLAGAGHDDAAVASHLYRRILGDGFDRLPVRLRALHARRGAHRYLGQVEAMRGTGLLSRLCAWIVGLPPAHVGAIEVEIDADAHGETWIRRFGGAAMHSRMRERDGLIHERLGPVGFAFALEIVEDGVVWRLRGVRAFGVGLPLSWFEGVHAREFERDGRYGFDVAAALPVIGLLVHYRGWLEVDVEGEVEP